MAGSSGVALLERVRATLALGPAPHAYQRIKRDGEDPLLPLHQEFVATFGDGSASRYRPPRASAAKFESQKESHFD